MSAARPRALMLCGLLGLLGLLGPLAHAPAAQSDPRSTPDPRAAPDPRDVPVVQTDPRSAKDPRDVADPRLVTDPREVEPDPLLEPPGPTHYDALYATGQDTKLKQAFGENGWSLLDYLQRQCETWLSLREREADTPASQEQLAAAEEKARKLARFADEALLDTRFQKHVSTVLGWSEEQRRMYREGQELYRQGMAIASAAREAHEAQGALTPLEQALDRARRLGDTRAQILALVAIGNLQSAVRDEERARVTMHEVVRSGRELRDLDSVWSALSVLYESAIRTLEWSLAEETLQEQYLIAQDAGDEQTVERVMRQLVNLNTFREDRR